MAIDWTAVAGNNQKTQAEREDRAALEGIQLAHKLSPNEAAWVAGRRKMEAEQAQERQHRGEQEAFLKHANAEMDKPGIDPRNFAEWSRCLAEVCLGRWPDSEMLRSSPEVGLRFQGLQARLTREHAAARPKVTRVANPFSAWK